MSLKRVIFQSVKFCLVVVFLSLFINRFIAYFCDVNGMSMSPSLYDNDRIVINRIPYLFDEPQRFDIVVFRVPGDHLLIKRIIGLPEESISYQDNQLFVNGELIEEGFLYNQDIYTEDFTLNELTSHQHIPPEHYFVLGDNRGASVDSRRFGVVHKDYIEGKAIIRWSPQFTWDISKRTFAKDK